MKALAIETSSTLGGAAVVDSALGLMAESRINVKAVSHSERLMAEVDSVLKSSGLTLKDIDILVAAIGPGSFTGLRIGIATLKGLAFATGIRCVGVPSLEAFAWGIGGGGRIVCPMFDARKKEVYAGAFRCASDGVARVIDEAAMPAQRFAEMLMELNEPVILAGEGAALYKDIFIATFGERAEFAPPHHMAPSPAALGHLGLMAALRGEFIEPQSLNPLYLRKSEAELKG